MTTTNTSALLLGLGSTLITVRGELDDGPDGERVTPAGSIGIVQAVYAEQPECYSVVFPATGGAIFLCDDEVRDAAQYQILDGAEHELAQLRCRVQLYHSKYIDEAEAVPTGEHYNDLYDMVAGP